MLLRIDPSVDHQTQTCRRNEYSNKDFFFFIDLQIREYVTRGSQELDPSDNDFPLVQQSEHILFWCQQ